jgi:hypothetical protein
VRKNADVVRQKANWDQSVAQMRGLYRRVIADATQAELVA